MPQFDSILFDFDGVLADTEPLHWATWAEVLKPLGVTLTWDYYSRHAVGIDDRTNSFAQPSNGQANKPLPRA